MIIIYPFINNNLNTNNYEKEHFYESDDGGHGSYNVYDIHSLWR